MFDIATGFFLTRERGSYCTAERMRQLNYMIEEILVSQGYQTLNAYGLPAKMSYETADQFDGMVSLTMEAFERVSHQCPILISHPYFCSACLARS